MQRNIFDNGTIPYDFADLQRAMGQMRTELPRLNKQKTVDDNTIETLTPLHSHAKQLHDI